MDRPPSRDRGRARSRRRGDGALRDDDARPSSGQRDFDTLRAIKNYRGLSARRTIDFGVYGVVERPGRVRVGDPVEPLTNGSVRASR